MLALSRPATDIASSISSSLPYTASQLAWMVWSLGKHSSVVSFACFSKDLRVLLGAIAVAIVERTGLWTFREIQHAS